ncbi:MAG: hypothetical protein IKO15_10550 [Clostridiales bacterium]|jgi:Na+/melibiose symporter-like transporter|nr:hypothetical protein [Clostridiales bacterium]
MNTATVIAGGIFLAISVTILIFFAVAKLPGIFKKYKMFFIASSGVYVSGALLVFIFTLIMEGLPVAFVIISDITILFVFLFTVGLIYFMTRSIVANAEKLEKKNNDELKK